MAVLFLLTNPLLLKNLKALRTKLEKAASYCRSKKDSLEILIIMDVLDGNAEMSSFRIERLCRWVSCFYNIPVRIRMLSSAVPILTAVEEVLKNDYRKVYYTPERSYLRRAIPKSVRLEFEELLRHRSCKLEVA